MMIEKLEEFRKYYKELEKLLINTEEYIAIDVLNYKAYSIKYNWLYQSICSEIDVVLKELAYNIDPTSKRENIDQCKKTILEKYPIISSIRVKHCAINEAICPWESWDIANPNWWKIYNNIKHHRVDKTVIDNENLPFYKLANQKNVLYALAGLYILEWFFIIEYKPTSEEIDKAITFFALRDKEKAIEQMMSHCAISLGSEVLDIEDFKGLKTFSFGYTHFNYNKLCEITKKD